MIDDSRVKKLQDAVASVDTKISAMTSSSDSCSSADQSFGTSVKENATEIGKLLDCIPDSKSGTAIRYWRDWNVASSKDSIADAVDKFLNPISETLLTQLGMDSVNLPSAVKDKYLCDAAYRPFIDPGDPDNFSETEFDECSSPDSSLD